MEEHGAYVELDLDFPISIETVLAVNLNIDSFKLVFDFILNVLRSHATSLNKMSHSIFTDNKADDLAALKGELSALAQRMQGHDQGLSENSTHMDKELSELKKRLDRIERVSEDLSEASQQLREKDSEHERGVAENSAGLQQLLSVSDNHETRIAQLEGEVDSLVGAVKSLGGEIEAAAKREAVPVIEKPAVLEKPKDHGPELSRLLREFEYLKNKLNEQQREIERTAAVLSENTEEIAKNTENTAGNSVKLSSLERDTLSNRENTLHNTEEINKLKEKLHSFEKGLKSKASAEDFAALQQYMHSSARQTDPAAPPPPPPPTVSKDLYLLRELSERVDELCSVRTQESLDELSARIHSKASKSDLDSLLQELLSLRAQLVGSSPAAVPRPTDSPDPKILTVLNRRVSALEDLILSLHLPEGADVGSLFRELNSLKSSLHELSEKVQHQHKEFSNKWKELENIVKSKPEFSDLNELEVKIQDRVIAICQTMEKKFADKTETKKSLKFLEKLVKGLLQRPREKGDGLDAMVARKPLGGWSCLSCEKALEQLMGKTATYHPWNKLPHRDPADRIARAGPGFSRMLITLQPELMASHTRRHGSSHRHEEEEANSPEAAVLPPVAKQERPRTSYYG